MADFALTDQSAVCTTITATDVCPGSAPIAFSVTIYSFSLPQSSVCLDYTIQGAGGGAPQLPTTGQIWPQGMYLGTYS